MKDKEFEKLLSELKGLKKPGLSEEKKFSMKKNLFTKMDAFSAARFSLDKVSRARIKERIMEVLETRVQKRSFAFGRIFGNLFFNVRFRAVVSIVTVFALVFGIFGVVRTDQDFVHAATLTFLRSYEGEVFVERDGEVLNGYEEMHLFENDVVYTSEGGRAVIEYFDNSVSRLSGETKIVFDRLERSEDFLSEGKIEVLILEGTVWSKVLNLSDSGVLFSVGAKEIFASADNAAFNFKVEDDLLEIGVFENAIDVRDEDLVERLVSGKKLTVSDGEKRQKSVSYVADGDREDEWIRKNLAYDKKYLSEVEMRLLAARAEAVGIDINDEITFDRSLKDNALMFFTFDDVKAKKRELDIAERNFIAAQIKLRYNDLTEEEMEEIRAVISDFDEKVRSFHEFAGNIAYMDEEYAESLKGYVADRVTVNKIDLEVVMPDSPVYIARGVVEELEFLLVKSSSEAASVKLKQAVNRLVAIDDVFYKEGEFWESGLADEYMKNVVKALSLLEGSGSGDDESVDETKKLLIEKIYEDIELLENIRVISSADIGKLRLEIERILNGEDGVDVVVASVPVYKAEDKSDGEIEDEVKIASDEDFEIVSIDDDLNVSDVPDKIIKGPYGVTVRGNKPLNPMLE